MMPASCSRRSTSASVNSATRSKSKPAKARAKILALAQDGQPGQAGLEAFEADLLEQPAVVGDGPAPFMVVVVAVVGQAARPGAAGDAVRPFDKPGVLFVPSA